MNLPNPNERGVPLGFRPAAALRQPWRPAIQTDLDDILDKAFGPLPTRPVAPSDDRICELLDHLNSSIRRLADGEADWASAAWVVYMTAQPEYLGTEYVHGVPVEFFLTGGVVLVWCADVMEWQHAVAARVSLAGVR